MRSTNSCRSIAYLSANRRSLLSKGGVVHCATVLTPPFDDYTDLLLSSVPEMELGWLEKAMASRRMEAAGN